MTKRRSTRRENSRKRPAPRFESAPCLLVVCGADRTEVQYIEKLWRYYRGRAAKPDFITDGVDPLTLVRKAAKIRRLHPRDFDEVWCVVDVDEFDLKSAADLARRSDVRMAVSNICFEYWLLLHFEDCETGFRAADGVMKRLRRHLPGYDKTSLEFDDFSHGVDKAAERAKRRSEFGREHLHNPSSGMWKLIEVVRPARSDTK